MDSRAKILIIDDDPDYVEGITSILQTGPYDVDVAYNPSDGMEALKSTDYDLLLLDIMMGRGAEGVQIARQMRKDDKLRQMPVLIITSIREQIAFLFPGQPVHPGFTADDELLEKPVKPDLLLEKVSEMLERAEARKSE
jgi:DNA-binding response OmpR family regulator